MQRAEEFDNPVYRQSVSLPSSTASSAADLTDTRAATTPVSTSLCYQCDRKNFQTKLKKYVTFKNVLIIVFALDITFLAQYIATQQKYWELPKLIKDKNGRRYLFIAKRLTFEKAASDCDKFGMKLVRIDNKEENDFLWKTMQKLIKSSGEGPWIGFHEKNGVEGKWQWIGSCGFNYTNWRSNEPNNYKHKTMKEDCAHFIDGGWNDLPCNIKLSYICEQYSNDEYAMEDCENQWSSTEFQYNGHEYKIVTERKSFYEAASHCRALGMQLVRIDNTQENNFLWKQFKNVVIYSKDSYGPWIGLHEENGEEKNWKWSGSCGVNFTYFAPNEPNNYGKGEDCVHFFKMHHGFWNDLSCNSKLPFICERYSPASYTQSCINSQEKFIKFDGRDYLFVDKKKPFYAAKEDCASRNMHMVRIDNKKENNFLWETSSKYWTWKKDYGPWIGLHEENGKEGNWIWEKYCGNYTNWAKNEPNNMKDEGCAHFFRQNGEWNDLSCETRLQYICEKYSTENYVNTTCSSGNNLFLDRSTLISVFAFQKFLFKIF